MLFLEYENLFVRIIYNDKVLPKFMWNWIGKVYVKLKDFIYLILYIFSTTSIIFHFSSDSSDI